MADTGKIILGIETSCDETAAAVVRLTPTAENPYAAEILSQAIYSQFIEHEAYGGVVPEIAARAHAERLPTLVKKALADANLSLNQLDGIAATTGPGLVGALLMGSTFGKTLALAQDLPFYATNHIEGHALTALITEKDLRPPYLLLLVSGGHCQLIQVEGIGAYTTLGSTLDDAIGECFDKVGKMCSLHDNRFTHPYAPKVEQAAMGPQGEDAIPLPQPQTSEALDFSFSGLKTAVRERLDKEARRNLKIATAQAQPDALQQGRSYAASRPSNPTPSSYLTAGSDQLSTVSAEFINALCAKFQNVAATSLSEKADAALERIGKMPLVVSGGVAVNKTIRSALTDVATKHGVPFYAPPLDLCADNAVMIAYTAALRSMQGESADFSSRARPRWPLENMSL